MKNRNPFLSVLLVCAVLLSFLAIGVGGCTGAQAVPGATCTFQFIKADGTKVLWTSDKDTSAKSITFDPTTGALTVTDLNSNGSIIAPAQLQAFVTQSNNATIISQAVTNAVLQALGKQGSAIVVPGTPASIPK